MTPPPMTPTTTDPRPMTRPTLSWRSSHSALRRLTRQNRLAAFWATVSLDGDMHDRRREPHGSGVVSAVRDENGSEPAERSGVPWLDGLARRVDAAAHCQIRRAADA